MSELPRSPFTFTETAHSFGHLCPSQDQISTLIGSMYEIRKLSKKMLEDKFKETTVHGSDTDAKRDIMSILVRARKADQEGRAGEQYTMNDQAMMDQVVSVE